MTPTEHLSAMMKKYPNATKYMNLMVRDKGTSLPNWPDWCLMPMAGWIAVITEGDSFLLNRIDIMKDIAPVSALGTWRLGMGIYRFAPELYEKASKADYITDMSDMSLSRFQGLPEWCVYVETPGFMYLDRPLDGFWAHLEWDYKTSRNELRLLLHFGDELFAIPLHLGKWDITQAAARFQSESQRLAREAGKETEWHPETIDTIAVCCTPLVSLLVQLCSGRVEVTNENGEHPAPAKPEKRGRELKYIPVNAPRIWTVG